MLEESKDRLGVDFMEDVDLKDRLKFRGGWVEGGMMERS